MTFEKKCLIEVSDIAAVHYECGKCGAATVVPVQRISDEQTAAIALRLCLFVKVRQDFRQARQK